MNIKKGSIGILTHYDVHNHGAQLQLFALIKVLNEYGYVASALQFKKNYDFLEIDANKKYDISIKSVPYYIKYFNQNGFKKTLYNIRKRKKLQSFRKKNRLIGEFYSREKSLDAVFIGSDEVFSLEPGLNTFFWGMGVPCASIFSYAGSFGPTNYKFIEENYACEFVEAGISRISKISVRDINSYDIIKRFTDKEIAIVCDPVILYGYENEKERFEGKKGKRYILIYAYDNNMNDSFEVEKIKKFAKEKELIIVSVGFFHKWCQKNINVSPIELLEYIYNAEFIITDTFHGSVMSLIMNKQFAVKIRNNSNKIRFLIDEYELNTQITKQFDDLNEIFDSSINYEKVNRMIEEKRNIANIYIESCLESMYEK